MLKYPLVQHNFEFIHTSTPLIIESKIVYKMKIHTPHTQLIKALDLVSRVSTKHVTLPVLQCVLIEAKEGQITFKATNLEISIEVLVEGSVESVGLVAVSAVTLLQSVQHLSTKDVSLVLEDNVLVVSSGKSVIKINTLPHDEFPTIQKINESGLVINRNQFSIGIKTVAPSASLSSIKPELGSVYIQQKREHSLTFVATDSFRLMEKTVPQKNLVLDHSFMVPVKNALELARVCDLLNNDPEIVVNENQCALVFPSGVYITSRLVSGSFPDYEQIIPKEFCTHTTVLKSDLAHTLKKTQIFLNKFNQVTIAVTQTELTASSQNGELGMTKDVIGVRTEGEDLTLNFNQSYLSEPIQHISDDSLFLHFAGIGRPLIIEGVNEKSLRYLVMPMNR